MESSQCAGIPSDPAFVHLLGQRVVLKAAVGSIKYVGKLLNNPKAGDDIWLGIEWDEEGQGKHNGTVDGVAYFSPDFHLTSPKYPHTASCSFIRHGKIQIGGQTFREALIERYRPDDVMTEGEKEAVKQADEELYVNTDKKGMKKI